MVRIDVTLVCVFLPLILGAPVDDALKQQVSFRFFFISQNTRLVISAGRLEPKCTSDKQFLMLNKQFAMLSQKYLKFQASSGE